MTLENILNDTLFFDFETTTFNKGHPFDPRNKTVSYVTALDNSVCFKHFTDPDFVSGFRQQLQGASVVCGFNIKFDLHWLRNLGISISPTVKVWDCQLAEFILSGQEARFASLKDTYESYGMHGAKSTLIEEYWAAGIDTDQIPPSVLEERGIGDVVPLKELMKIQYELLSPKQRQLVWLEGEDLKALADAEYNGVKFDVERARRELESLGHTVTSVSNTLSKFLPDGIPDNLFNWDSGDHLSAFLYGGTIEFKYVSEILTYKTGSRAGTPYNKWSTKLVEFPQRFKPLEGTEVAKTKDKIDIGTRLYQTDGPTLKQLKVRNVEQRTILSLLDQRAKAIKVYEMTESIMKKMADMGWENNLIHGQFNQNNVITGRLSSSGPNLQNTPPEVDALLVSRYE